MKFISKIRNIITRIKYIPYTTHTLNIAIYCDGGVGDCLVHLNYAKKLKEYIGDNCEIDFYYKSKIVEKLYRTEDNYLRGYFTKNDLDRNFYLYDVIIRMKERLPMVSRIRWKRLQLLNSKLFNLVRFYEDYYGRFKFFYDYSPRVDGFSHLLALIQDGNRVTQPDVGHKLGITGLDLTIKTNDDEKILETFNLESGKFITFNRSVDNTTSQKESTKLWPISYYLELLNLLHEKCPNIKLVFIGPEVENYVPAGIINLSGQTSFDELLVLLKHSMLHVGPEGGMIHMRHALCGKPSCVLFGPTSRVFYGYSENYNIEMQNICISSCEWMIEHWQRVCIKTDNKICKKLQALEPNTVYKIIEQNINKIKNK